MRTLATKKLAPKSMLKISKRSFLNAMEMALLKRTARQRVRYLHLQSMLKRRAT
jgi:hypothetical protein